MEYIVLGLDFKEIVIAVLFLSAFGTVGALLAIAKHRNIFFWFVLCFFAPPTVIGLFSFPKVNKNAHARRCPECGTLLPKNVDDCPQCSKKEETPLNLRKVPEGKYSIVEQRMREGQL